MASKSTLIWMDLEMTGLDYKSQRIIEVAAVTTSWDFKPKAEYHAVIHQPESVMVKMDAWCKVQHGKTGLTKAVKSGKLEKTVEKELVEFVKKYCEKPAILAGSSVHFDRRFIAKYWPKFESLLHYRILDVSAWKVVMMGKYDIKFAKREAHRALDDINGSIEELQYYLKLLDLPKIARSQAKSARAKPVFSEREVSVDTSKEEKQVAAEISRSGREGALGKSSKAKFKK